MRRARQTPSQGLRAHGPQAAFGFNLLDTNYFCQTVLPSMVEARQRTIINILSGAARNPGLPGGMIYGAAKAAVNNVTTFINAEFRGSGVRTSIVMPGEIDTPALSMDRPVPPPESAKPLMFTADDVADAICLIADMPPRACVELVVRPAMPRDTSGEMPPA